MAFDTNTWKRKRMFVLTGSYAPTAVLNHVSSFDQCIAAEFARRLLASIHKAFDRVPDDVGDEACHFCERIKKLKGKLALNLSDLQMRYVESLNKGLSLWI
jgi:hypothetical protein